MNPVVEVRGEGNIPEMAKQIDKGFETTMRGR